MAYKSQVHTLRGKVMYAKVIGEPRLNFSKDGKEWTLDLMMTPDLIKEVKAMGLSDRIRSKETQYDGAKYMSFRQRELRADGKANDPIEVKDILGKPWGDKLLGNGTVVDLKFKVTDYGPGKKAGVYPQSIRVLDHVPFESADFAEISEDDVYFKKALEAQEAAMKNEGKAELDDSVEDIGEDEEEAV